MKVRILCSIEWKTTILKTNKTQIIMKQITKLLFLFTTLVLFGNCAKDECQGSTYNKNVDESYLPDIIPYSDTSTRLFLKNGRDTLLFTSQGLKEEIVKDYSGEGTCDTYNLQRFSLKMAASDTDFFEIKYYTTRKGGFSRVNFNLLSGVNYEETDEFDYSGFRNYYKYLPIVKLTILNNVYDTVYAVPLFDENFQELLVKTKIGVLKIKTSRTTYELIK